MLQPILDCCAADFDRHHCFRTDVANSRTNGALQSMSDYESVRRMIIAFIFILGVGNFALHKAVIESGHSLLEKIPGSMRQSGGRITLGLEFLMLLSAMLLSVNWWPAMAWAYAIYSAMNGLSAWLILTRRV